jgi:hypothetical protein
MPRTRSRRRLATVAAAALAFAGLAIAPPAAEAALVSPSDPDARISPSEVAPGELHEFTVEVEGSASNAPQYVAITVPEEFANPSNPRSSPPPGWTKNYDAGTRTFMFSTQQGSNRLGANMTITATITAVAPTTPGDYTWRTVAKPSPNPNAGSDIPVSPQPIVTVRGNLAQVIDFAPLGDRTFGDADFTVAATGGASGNPVTFTAEGQCTATGTNGSTISLTGAGECSVTAAQAGGNGYDAAAPVTRTFTIHKADQAISFDPIETQTYGDGPLDLVASSSSGLPVSFSATGTCSVSGTSLSLDGAGDCTVTATQAGDNNYNAAEQVQRSFTIQKAGAVLSLDDLGPFTYDGNAHHASVSTDPAGLDGVTLTYSRNGEQVAAPTAAGSYDVTATLDNGNYAAEQVTGTLVIEQAQVTGSFTVADRDYDGETTAEITGCSLAGAVTGDDVALDCTNATATFDSKNAGSRTATLSGGVLSGDDAPNYVLGEVEPASATITPRTVTGAITAGDKNYDGTTTASASGLPLEGVVGSDDVAVDVVSADFDSKEVGRNKTVTAHIALTGEDADNYRLSSDTATAEANIWARLLVGSFTAEDKVYDGNTDAIVHPLSPLADVVGDEQVSLQVTNAAFADKNVGEDKVVTATLTLVGPDAGNYTLDPDLTSNTALADITARTVDGSFTAGNKVYDGNTDASITGRSLAAASGDTGKVAGDDVELSGGTASFADKNVGTWTVTGSGFGLTGDDAGNYALGDVADTTAEITAKELTGSFTAADKVYDGNTDATITDRHLDGVVGEDKVELTGGAATFADKNVGADKEVTGTGFALAGSDSGNYTLASSTLVTTADITAKELTGSFAAHDKVWDGTASATISGRYLDGVVAGDDVTLTGGSASFDNANVGTSKTVSGGGFTLTGDDAGNYALAPTQPWYTTAAITPLYSGTGFYKPVDMPNGTSKEWNTIKGGQTVPLKFEVFNANTGVEQTSLSVFGPDAAAQAQAFKVTKVGCTSDAAAGEPVDFTTTGGTSLRYDGSAGQFIQNWKTPTGAGNCYAVTVKTVDGTTVGPAYFQIKK